MSLFASNKIFRDAELARQTADVFSELRLTKEQLEESQRQTALQERLLDIEKRLSASHLETINKHSARVSQLVGERDRLSMEKSDLIGEVRRLHSAFSEERFRKLEVAIESLQGTWAAPDAERVANLKAHLLQAQNTAVERGNQIRDLKSQLTTADNQVIKLCQKIEAAERGQRDEMHQLREKAFRFGEALADKNIEFERSEAARQRMQERLEKLVPLALEVNNLFTSGNAVDVSHARVSKAEWDALFTAILELGDAHPGS